MRFAPPALSTEELRGLIPQGALYLSFAVTEGGRCSSCSSADRAGGAVRIALLSSGRRRRGECGSSCLSSAIERCRWPTLSLPAGRSSKPCSRSRAEAIHPGVRRPTHRVSRRTAVGPAICGARDERGRPARVSRRGQAAVIHAVVVRARRGPPAGAISKHSAAPVALVVGNPVFARQDASTTEDERFRGGCAVEALPGTQREADKDRCASMARKH